MHPDAKSVPSFSEWQQRCRSDAMELVQRALRAAGLQHQAGVREAWLMGLACALTTPSEAYVPVRNGLSNGTLLMSEAEVSEAVIVKRLLQDMHTAADWLLMDLQARGWPLWQAELLEGEWLHVALLHPARLVDTLCRALKEAVVAPQQRLEFLLRLASPLTRLLNPLYERQLEWLEHHGVGAPRISPAAGGLPLEAMAAGRPQMPVQGGQGTSYPPSMPTPTVGFTPSQVPSVPTRMAQQAGLDAGMTRLMADLALPLQRSVAAYPAMLTDAQGVPWRLVERLVALGQLYPLHKPGKLPLEQRMAPLIERLQRSKLPAKDSAYQRVLDHVEQMHIAALKAAAEAQSQAESQLDFEVQRDELEPLMMFQMMDRLGSHAPKADIRQFLLGPWVQVLARVSALNGADSPEMRRWSALADTLMAKGAHDLNPPLSPAELDGLLLEVREGLAAGEHSEDRIRSHVSALMTALDPRLHPLSGMPASTPEFPAAPNASHALPTNAISLPIEPEPAGTVARSAQLLEPLPLHPGLGHTALGSEDILSSRWAHHAELDTVPQALKDDPPESPGRLACAAWIKGLDAGQLCRVFIQGRWTSARLDWISDRQRFYSFSRPRNTPFTASLRVLERMRTEGLITSIDPGQWLQAAAKSLPLSLE